MNIREVQYNENKMKTLQGLTEYTLEKVPDLQEYYRELSYVYEEDGKIIGRIVGHIHWDFCKIDMFYVDKDIQSKGVGTKLLKHFEKEAIQDKCKYIYLETMSFNAPRFYLKHGYSIMGEFKNSPIEDTIHYFMVKEL